ncbi:MULTISPECIES: Fic family protein [Mycobacteriaceae]|uniref:protein adenylyltransferase n=1 Tax=Mycolicibacterium mucogenicum DSM 44124 TaxID=1226753 RepID=A0A8H2JDG8_MYCMU|nr:MULTISPECIES: Fic family protein [Mycobacteriaceae]KAB7756932.1 cell filamentation protein Fic [Mycolicibacterium mucogenicum DSM 44124]QPG67432.1 Fic family protein [Mycolicibacterium mucogenicum DSM 44124]SEB13964.1 cell filamentation protein [Mycobacterium sp. 283mftsu]
MATTLLAQHAVQQTLAAQRIEGWEPQPAHIVELGALASGAVEFDDYLARCRAQYPPTPEKRRRFFQRRAPYLIPGTSVLRNNFGIQHGPDLAAVEFQVTAGRMVLWHCRQSAAVTEIDVRAMHRELFGDVYEWAGELRTVDIRRGDSAFTWQVDIAAGLAEIELAATALADVGAEFGNPRLAWELSRIYARYNQIHPFREGNGRTGMLLLHALAGRCGRQLDFTGVSRAAWYSAARDSMPLHRDGRLSHRPFLWLLNPAVKSS